MSASAETSAERIVVAVQLDRTLATQRCVRLRRRILDMSQEVSALHIAGAFSCLEMVDTVYQHLLRRAPDGSVRDTFILSKGHGSLAQYASLEELGVLSRQEMDLYCKVGGILGVHPDRGNPGIEASTGSLGHGLAIGMGMAVADRVRLSDRTVFVLMSDGELQEGSVWEAMLLAPTLKLTNLVALVDLNDYQTFAKTSVTHPNFYPVIDKVRAFGWEAAEIDGHDHQAIYDAVASRSGTRPFIVLGKTIKGKGVSFMENVPMWHYRSPSPDEYAQAVRELTLAEQ